MRQRGLISASCEMVAVLTAIVMFTVMTGIANPQSQRPRSAVEDISLRKFLQNYIGARTDENKTTRCSAAFVDLEDEGAEDVIVHLTSDGWCGTGGCTTLILAPDGASYRVVTKITITRLPIRVLATKSNGWHDIGVVARISGNEPLSEAILSFDGKTYPSSPSMPPARRSDAKAEGKTVMAATVESRDLYR